MYSHASLLLSGTNLNTTNKWQFSHPPVQLKSRLDKRQILVGVKPKTMTAWNQLDEGLPCVPTVLQNVTRPQRKRSNCLVVGSETNQIKAKQKSKNVSHVLAIQNVTAPIGK